MVAVVGVVEVFVMVAVVGVVAVVTVFKVVVGVVVVVDFAKNRHICIPVVRLIALHGPSRQCYR